MTPDCIKTDCVNPKTALSGLTTRHPDIVSWLESLPDSYPADEITIIEQALAFSLPHYENRTLPDGEPVITHALGIAAVLAAQRVDCDTLAAGLLHAVPDYLDEYPRYLQTAFSPVIVRLVEGIARIDRIPVASTRDNHDGSSRTTQTEALRQMLLAMTEDIRVVIIVLADRTHTMRYLVASDITGRTEAARDTLDIFSPLANRLGLGQMKWELEDLSFHILEPERYREIARLLEETRTTREQYIALFTDRLQKELLKAGIMAEVSGRPKHIYSIHKKMIRKDLDFSRIYDALAVRVLTDSVSDCYTVLGIVHNLWGPVLREFDDYIAKPKSNHYRSLHTAITGPENRIVEVQIRTHEMHRSAEMGIAAHWRYKEGARYDAGYEEKITWIRQMLAWKDDAPGTGELADHYRIELFQNTVYVLTPQGRVISLPKGSTPVDFAYHVHSDLGHRCRGAKVNGAIVTLDYPLQNTQQVEILAARQGGPSRDWLNPTLGYLASPRARAKVRQWFSRQDHEMMQTQGRLIIEKELQRQGMTALRLDTLASRLGFDRLDECLIAVAKGSISNHQMREVLTGTPDPATPGPTLLTGRKPAAAGDHNVLIVGVDKLLTTLARCCKPVPPDPVTGFVTRGHGITIHREGCRNLAGLTDADRTRLIAADWGVSKDAVYPADIIICAQDKQGLLRDISDIFSREKTNITAINTRNQGGAVTMQLTVGITSIASLNQLLRQVAGVTGVLSAVRKQAAGNPIHPSDTSHQ